MPPDRSRTSNLQGRQRSCSQCAKGKRRCDLRQPSCMRCSRQSLLCLYPPQPCADGTPNSRTDTTAPEIISGEDDVAFELAFPEIPAQAMDLLDFDFGAGAASVQSLDNLFNGNTDHDAAQLSRINYLPSKASLPFQMSSFVRSRTEYSMERLGLAPRMMVEENATPWSHRNLYEDHIPRSIQDAHAACALYISKNDRNAIFIIRHITHRATELANSSISDVPSEVLARAHALLLYNSMLLFSGEVRYCAQVEALVPHMKAIGEALCTLVACETDPSGPLALYPSTAAESAWKSFIFRESLRRTLLAVFQSLAFCNLFLETPGSCSHDYVSGNRVTYQRALWDAETAFDFAMAWNDKYHFLIRELDFDELLRIGQADDVDVFGKMLLTGLLGTDNVKGWLHTRGGKL
ncbi:hypothetical protein BDV95DRAFT_26855 [Massariosphaeria phaeospora]|uniref:Zn(2)-C6 fungal-type domain-containing protein n=1 Tax=Massariosphaeria phaeospora TaxID=100035 RepID=A0A7C8I670_9PLEO|nr:hypothetical protein BDV95DRAFT_26855 [Massariosphaeria phaeospora]